MKYNDLRRFATLLHFVFNFFEFSFFFGIDFSTNRNNRNKTTQKRKAPDTRLRRRLFSSQCLISWEMGRVARFGYKDNPMVSFWQRFCRKYFTIGYTFTAYLYPMGNAAGYVQFSGSNSAACKNLANAWIPKQNTPKQNTTRQGRGGDQFSSAARLHLQKGTFQLPVS